MQVEFVVTVTVEKTAGKFVAKTDIIDALRDEVEGMNPGSVDVEDSEYEITEWEVNEK